MANNKLAIIGGSGLYDVEEFKNRELLQLKTPWGNPSDQILKTDFKGKEIYLHRILGFINSLLGKKSSYRARIDF